MNYIATHNNYNQLVCTCPHCSSDSLIRSGFDRGTQRYRCKSCRKTFKATAGTPAHGLHKKEKIVRYLKALHAGMSVRKAAEYVGISNNTSFAWRHRFLSSLEARSSMNTTSKTSSARIIQLEYSAKGRRKLPEKNTSPTKTIVLHRDAQLELHKLNPVKTTNHAAKIFTESTASFFATVPHKIINTGIKRAENAVKMKNRKANRTLIAKVKQQTVKLLNWMERFRGVASKYLQNYWNWYTSLNNLSLLKQEREHFYSVCISSRSLARYYITKNI